MINLPLNPLFWEFVVGEEDLLVKDSLEDYTYVLVQYENPATDIALHSIKVGRVSTSFFFFFF